MLAVMLLIKFDARVDLLDRSGRLALHYAALHGQDPMVGPPTRNPLQMLRPAHTHSAHTHAARAHAACTRTRAHTCTRRARTHAACTGAFQRR